MSLQPPQLPRARARARTCSGSDIFNLDLFCAVCQQRLMSCYMSAARAAVTTRYICTYAHSVIQRR